MGWQPVSVGMQHHGQWWWRLWNAGPQGHMRTAMGIMRYPCGQKTLHMVCRQRDYKVQAFPPQRTDEPLAEGIGLGALWWRFEDSQAQVSNMLVKLRGENAVPIMQEETVSVISWDGFAQLLQYPLGSGMCRHMTVEYAARRMFHHDKDVEQAKGGRDYDTEVTCDDRLGMIAHKGAPVLRGRAFASTMVHAPRHVFAHCAWRYLEASFSNSAFAMRSSPHVGLSRAMR
jgi:hypothetical protein